MSTDRFEKPKRTTQTQPEQQVQPPASLTTGSLPRRGTNGVFYRTPQDFVGRSQSQNHINIQAQNKKEDFQQHDNQNQSSLRRNCSMSDLRGQQLGHMPQQQPAFQVLQNNCRVNYIYKQVPPSMVRSIVVTVLQSQVSVMPFYNAIRQVTYRN